MQDLSISTTSTTNNDSNQTLDSKNPLTVFSEVLIKGAMTVTWNDQLYTNSTIYRKFGERGEIWIKYDALRRVIVFFEEIPKSRVHFFLCSL